MGFHSALAVAAVNIYSFFPHHLKLKMEKRKCSYMFAPFLPAKQSRDLCTVQVLLKDKRRKVLKECCCWGEVLGLNISFPDRALVTVSHIPEGSCCITTGVSKWKPLQQVGKGWEQLSRFQERNYSSLPISTHGTVCSACPLPPERETSRGTFAT